uniref:Uncharacterized protein n=1 Tax=Arundo donax TaxID=35708 RepID=A0A0A9H3P7_ARUDO
MHQARLRRQNIRQIPGSDADDVRIINETDSIRLQAINVIQRFL